MARRSSNWERAIIRDEASQKITRRRYIGGKNPQKAASRRRNIFSAHVMLAETVLKKMKRKPLSYISVPPKRVSLWRNLIWQWHINPAWGGIPQCPEKAFYWTERSASQGYARAELYLGVCYTEGRGTPVDYAAAMKWYHKAADQGDTDAQICIGYQYLRGNGVGKDAEKAKEYFLSAAKDGNSAGINELAKCYFNGEFVKQDRVHAVELFRQAAENGFPDAQYHLGMCYALGVGIKKDTVAAQKWLDLATANGFVPPDSDSP